MWATNLSFSRFSILNSCAHIPVVSLESVSDFNFLIYMFTHAFFFVSENRCLFFFFIRKRNKRACCKRRLYYHELHFPAVCR